MAHVASTATSIRRFRRFRRWAIALAALASLLVAGSATAVVPDQHAPRDGGVVATESATQDLRSPDGRAGAVVSIDRAAQDLRSPDAANTTTLRLRRTQPAAAAHDLRSPDAREAGGFVSSPQDSSGSSGGSDWIYLAVAGLASLAMIGASVLLLQRHRRHEIAPSA
jgi:hypothetical protein